MLKIKNIDAFFGKIQVLRHVSLHVGAGEIVALIGAWLERRLSAHSAWKGL